jgi:Ca2+-binding EF-hand superfamily protein
VASNPGQLFAQIDTNGDGKISLAEAAHWFARLANRTEPDILADQEFRELFNQADIDGDGFIQPWELDMSLNMAIPKSPQPQQQE